MRLGCVLILVAVVQMPCLGVPYTVPATPSGDAFVRSMEPDGNYGKAGGLSVSGSAALNRQGQQMGTLDTFMRFDLADVVAEMDSHFGGQPWAVQSAVLHLTEQGAPNHPMFNRGVGDLEILWIAADGWEEGTGTPKSVTTDGVSFSDEASLLDPASDVPLGLFANSGVDGPLAFELELPGAFVADLMAGGDVSLFLTAAGESIGFTFNSADISGGGRLPPSLEITAEVIPEPATLALLALGLCVMGRRGRARRRDWRGNRP